MVLGSSTAAGVGASRYEKSWVGQFVLLMQGRGFRVINSSISGSNTATSLARFDTDVAALRPDFVVLATSIVNEGFVAAPQAAWDRYVANTRDLVRKVVSIGAMPIVAGMYPADVYSDINVSLLHKLYLAEESLGTPIWDFWGSVAGTTGRWLPGMTNDGLHPSDLGHLYLFNSIPLTYFDQAYDGSSLLGGVASSVFVSPEPEDGSEIGRIDVSMDRPAMSWTIAAWIKDAGHSDWRVYLRAGSSSGEHFRLERQAGDLVIREGETVALRVPLELLLDQPIWSHIALTYQQSTSLLRLFLNGVERASVNTVSTEALTNFEFGSGCAGCAFADLVTYRSSLESDSIRQLANGIIPRRSLEFWGTPESTRGSGQQSGANHSVHYDERHLENATRIHG
ncbi:MAG: GDSL-type esterase/lipase family protein [Paludibaculum sp.]